MNDENGYVVQNVQRDGQRVHVCSPACSGFPAFLALPISANPLAAFEIRVDAMAHAQERPRLGRGGRFYDPSAPQKRIFLRIIRETGLLPNIPLDGAIHASFIFEYQRPLNDFRK